MNKEEFISHWTEKLKPWADLQLLLSNSSSISEDQKKDISKLISPDFYSTKETLILLLQLTQGFLINDHEDFSFYFSILEFLIPKIKEFLTPLEIFSIYHKTFNHVLLWYYDHELLDIKTITSISKNDPEIFQYFIEDIKEHDEETYNAIYSRYNDSYSFITMPNFKEKRETRINESLIAKVIQEDNIEEFQSIISSTNLKINSKIPYSIFESCVAVNYSNDMPTLIEYASFFGSINIFKYLLMQNVEIDSNIWEYAIHSKNYDIIHLLEDRHIKYSYCVQNSIRFYRFELFDYFTENQNIEINRDCINRAILNFNLPILTDPRLLGSLYDDPNLTSSKEGDWNPLICSALKSYPIITKMLLSIPKISTNILYTNEFASPLLISIRNLCFENVKLLCEYPTTDINMVAFSRNALCMATGVGDVQILKYLLNLSNENMNSSNSEEKKLKTLKVSFDSFLNPFNWAVSNNHLEVVKILYFDPLIISEMKKCDREINIHSYIALLAARCEFWDCFKFIIQSEPDEQFDELSNIINQQISDLVMNKKYIDDLFNEEIKRRKESNKKLSDSEKI